MMLALPSWANKQTTIYVGGYHFSPYVNVKSYGDYSGLSIDLIAALNRVQNKYHFVFVSTSASHRHAAYARGRFQMMLFEDLSWGWQNFDVKAVPLNFDDGEVYITQNVPDRGQSYFDNIDGKTLTLVAGYHYQLVNFETDKASLDQQYQTVFVNNNQASIAAITRQRADIAPITWSYLQYHLKLWPEKRKQLLISQKWDQKYRHMAILHPNAKITAEELNDYLNTLRESGRFAELAHHYGITLLDHNYGLISE
ncbi:transporter substrate-binding domain-containing protein [Motilimonas pumila]|uniref:ABC transporter substrate-binding protein n=1 Tax=Motilimonas pumila TaxID=2303987 RepID=A0A418YBV7_9GAMM|nr:transporter substrate-binding domain-containing protein [Motilimonas pumila]RJG41929.1 ABC transporter substrate-binding protein [Motilimonas pumila]